MSKIKYQFCNGNYREIEVTEEFAVIYNELEHEEALIERKETRRHQSLDKSLENGFDVADTVNIEEETVKKETVRELKIALKSLTDKQRLVLITYTVHGKSFREIADKLGVSKEAVRVCYLSAVEKIKKILK